MENISSKRSEELSLAAQVETLSKSVKDLALNLAIYLAKAKRSSDRLSALEPEFVRLVNGAVNAVQQVAEVMNSGAASTESGPPPSAIGLESKLRHILAQCAEILSLLRQKDGERS